MIAPELIGCRVVEEDDWEEDDSIMGKIVGQYNDSDDCYFIIMKEDGKIIVDYSQNIMVHPEDLKKLNTILKPRPIESRSEILDIRER